MPGGPAARAAAAAAAADGAEAERAAREGDVIEQVIARAGGRAYVRVPLMRYDLNTLNINVVTPIHAYK